VISNSSLIYLQPTTVISKYYNFATLPNYIAYDYIIIPFSAGNQDLSFEECGLMSYNAMYFAESPTFGRNISPPHSGSNSKPSGSRRQVELCWFLREDGTVYRDRCENLKSNKSN
jgi:hypothetical protein